MKFATLRIWLLLSLLLSLGTLPFLAQCTTQNLADTINDLNVTEDSEWSAVYSQFLSIKNASAFDDVAISALEKRDYKQGRFWAFYSDINVRCDLRAHDRQLFGEEIKKNENKN